MFFMSSFPFHNPLNDTNRKNTVNTPLNGYMFSFDDGNIFFCKSNTLLWCSKNLHQWVLSWFWIAKNIKPPLSGDPTRFPPVEWICEICPEYLLVRFFLNIQCKLLLQFLQSLQSVSPCPFELQITNSFLEWKYYQKCFYVCNLNKFVQLNHFYNNGWWDRQE